MFKKINLLIAVFAALHSNAQIEEQIVRQVEKVSGQSSGATQVGGGLLCTNCLVQSKELILFNQCVSSVCTAKGLLSLSNYPTITPEALAKPADGESEIEGLIDQIQGVKSFHDSDEFNQKIITQLKKGNIADSEENLRAAFQFLITTSLGRVLKFNPTTFEAEVNEEEMAKLVLPFSEQNQVAYKAKLRSLIANFPNARTFLSDDNPTSYLAAKYPGLSKVDAVKKLISDLKSTVQEIKNTNIGRLISQISSDDFFFPAEIVNEIESGRDVSEGVLRELIAKKNEFSSSMLIFDKGWFEKEKTPIDFDDIKARLISKENLESLVLSDNKKKQEENLRREDDKALCLSAYRRNLQILPSKAQIKDLHKEISDLKKSINERWTVRYSKKTSEKISDVLSQVNFVTPPEKNVYRQAARGRFLRKLEEAKRLSGVKIESIEASALMVALINFQKKFFVGATDDEKSDLSELCRKDTFSPLNDANYTLLGKVQVSHTTVHAAGMGRGVLAHEIGHSISQIFRGGMASSESSTTYKREADCLASLHQPHSKQYVEEDYADWVAASVTEANKACLYGFAYSQSSKELDNVYPNDSHSSNFFRLMHIESLQRGKLPDQCNSFLVEQGTPKDFLLCHKQRE